MLSLTLPLMAGLSAAPLAPQPSLAIPHPAVAPAQEGELFSLYLGDMHEMLSDPRDAMLRRFLDLLPQRLRELPGEVPDMSQMPPEVIELVSSFTTGPKSLRVYLDEESASPVPIMADLTWVTGDAAQTRQKLNHIVGLLQGAGAPIGEPGENGRVELPLPAPFPVALEPRGDSIALTVGGRIPGAMDPSALGLLPDGVSTDLALTMDMGRILDSVLHLMFMKEPEAAQNLEHVIDALALDDVVLQVGAGCDAQRGITVAKMTNTGTLMERLGVSHEHRLSAGHLRLIPKSATLASISLTDMGALLDLIDRITAPHADEMGAESLTALLAAQTGVDPRKDVTDHLGLVNGLYMSDATGGGGLLSTVIFWEVKNAEGLQPFLERMGGMINGLGAAEADGYVRTSSWNKDGVAFNSLTFPGIPVPIEPTFAIVDGYLFAGATPAAATAAVQQLRDAGDNLGSHPGFQQQLPGNMDGAVTMTFFDTPRKLASGYGFLTLAGAAMRNAVRSPLGIDLERGNHEHLPSLQALSQNARCSVTLGSMQGEDYYEVTYGDRSVLATLGGVLGFLNDNALLAVLPLAAAKSTGMQESHF